MILENGTVKVMDYGIARAQRFEGLTATGAFLGTPNYVAPETAEGKTTDARGDLYSPRHHLLRDDYRPETVRSGQPAGHAQKALQRASHAAVVDRPTVPRRLEAIILKLLAKSPDDRHPDAEHLLVDLRDFSNQAPR